MNQYGFWNARGTSNSEYGKFNFLRNMQQQGAPTSQYGAFNVGGSAWGSGGYGQQQQQQHHPECQNVQQGYYGQQQGYVPQNYYHQPGCPNAAKNKWAMQGQGQMQMLGQQQDGTQPRFTIEVGEEAAAAALGGQAQFENNFMMPQQFQGAPMTTMMMNPQQHQGEGGAGNIEQSTGDNDAEPTCQATEESASAVASEIPLETGGGDQGDSVGKATEDSSAQPTPQLQATPAKAKPGKWRGLSSVKYGRNAIPQMRSGDMSKDMQELESKMHNLQFIPGEMPPPNPRMMSGKSATRMMANNSSGQEQQPVHGTINRSASAAPKPNLCGKCNKCKAILPPDMGLPTLTFPSRSSMNLKALNTGARSKHYLGRQDAQNFRAVNYHRRV